MLTSSYVEGSSFLHRARPGVKLFGLLVVTTAVVVVPSATALAVVAGLLVAITLAAGLGMRTVVDLAKPMRWVVLLLTPVQVWTSGWEQAVVVVGGLVVAVVAAGLVTVTTRVADMMDAIVAFLRPLERVGVDADRVGLAMALTIRSIPVVARTLTECGEARRARGLERSPRALLVPFVVRTVRHAERMGDALVARGLDDGGEPQVDGPARVSGVTR
ncbi:energy-coupling factor transporter transmembrane component T family protein [Mobilicoccus pelagius]|uniref:Putative ABC transporter permease protein n=1 Tax=Mobilicoccus pelagius NBRC 104925 TaxID=1089455 RepID=H5UQ94_9MICO|nr:energy-coupling factor transporter transmembrane protein EcfT [Mobilicoccus pelagius]GAB47902.1 putative ABC transporter permease protein [Mobilicoccus pelagius NBRC 104925]